MGALNDWSTIDANNNATPPDGWPENTMQYSEVNDTGRAVQGTVRRFWGDINGSLAAGGVADAYTVTLNESGYTAYFAGMYFACEIMATNTGASTIDVNGIGVQTITDRAGNPLSAGELQAGGIYEFRYDGTNFQLMGTIAGGTGTLNAAILTNSNAPDLVDTDVALNVGAADPTAATHIEVGPQQIQAKADATTEAAVSINALGGDVQLGAQSGTGSVIGYDDGNLRFNTTPNAVLFRSDDNGDPTVPDAITFEFSLRSQDGNEYGEIGYSAGSILRIFNRAHGGDVRLQAEDLSGVGQIVFNGDPDAGAGLYFAGELTLFTQDHGVQLRGNVAGAVPQTYNTFLELANGDGTAVIGEVGFVSSFQDAFIIRSVNHGRNINIWAEDNAGTGQNLAVFDPDALRFLVPQEGNGVATFGSTSAASMPFGASAEADHAVRTVSLTSGDQVGYTAYVADGVRNTRAFFGLHDNDVWGLGATASSGNLPFIIEWAGTSHLEATPGGDVALFDNGTEVARTLAAASGGFEANNTLTGAGFERVLTTSDLGGGASIEGIVKSSTTSRNSTTTKTQDPDIVFNTVTGEEYVVVGNLMWNESAGNNQGLRLDWVTGQSGSHGGRYCMLYTAGQVTPGAVSMAWGGLGQNNNIQNGDSTNRNVACTITANAITGGDFGLAWAQVLNDANNTNVLGVASQSQFASIRVGT